jgi:hypothetical protein
MMETVSNLAFTFRVVVAAVLFTTVGFISGYFGPLYLFQDAGVAPVTGYFAAPVGTLVGIVAAVWGSMKGFKPAGYALRLAIIAMIFAALILALFFV